MKLFYAKLGSHILPVKNNQAAIQFRLNNFYLVYEINDFLMFGCTVSIS